MFVIPETRLSRLKGFAITAEISQNFSVSAQELRSAVGCYLLEQYTAAVFHSMRSLEAGLSWLATDLGVVAKNPNWGNINYLPFRGVSRRSPLHNAIELRHFSSPRNVQSGPNGFQLRCVAGHLSRAHRLPA